MDKVFELVYESGPHGDSCLSYNIKFNGKPTLKEFINQILKNHKDEWGKFYVYYNDKNAPEYATSDEREKHIIIEYKNGKIIKSELLDFANKMMNNKIDVNWKRSFANGGWSLMSYWIKINN